MSSPIPLRPLIERETLGDELAADPYGFTQEYRPPLGERLARRLGFRHAYQERPEETPEFPSYMVTKVRVRLSFLDRLRVLVRGGLELETVVQTDVEVHETRSFTNVGVAW